MNYGLGKKGWKTLVYYVCVCCVQHGFVEWKAYWSCEANECKNHGYYSCESYFMKI